MGKMTVEQMERKIVKTAAECIINAGYKIAVYDGETTSLSRTDDVKSIIDAMFATDEDWFRVYDADKTPIGWVRFAYGNNGWDVIADYTFSTLEKELSTAKALAEAMENHYG